MAFIQFAQHFKFVAHETIFRTKHPKQVAKHLCEILGKPSRNKQQQERFLNVWGVTGRSFAWRSIHRMNNVAGWNVQQTKYRRLKGGGRSVT